MKDKKKIICFYYFSSLPYGHGKRKRKRGRMEENEDDDRKETLWPGVSFPLRQRLHWKKGAKAEGRGGAPDGAEGPGSHRRLYEKPDYPKGDAALPGQPGGGAAAQADGTFGSLKYVGLSALVLILIIFFNRSSNRYLRMSSIVIGLATGYVVAWLMGMVDFTSIQSYGGITLPHPFRFGLDISLSAVISLALIFIITAIEAYGDITANSMISGEPVEGDKFIRRASGGILADGFNSMLSGMLCAFPNSVFAQNNGMIQLTGVASRYVGYYIAALLVLLGLFPAVGLVFSLMPEPVLGGATLLMFGTVAAAGIRIIAAQEMNRKATLVIAISFSLGLSIELVPDILCQLPTTLRNIFSSGITTGGLTAILTNVLIRIKE